MKTQPRESGSAERTFAGPVLKRKTAAWVKTRACITLVFGSVLVTLAVYAASFFINDGIDWRVLQYVNPDSPVPFVDDLMILVTDFSMAFFGLALLSLYIGCQIVKYQPRKKISVKNGLKIAGIFFSLMACSAYFWGGYAHRFIFFPLALLTLGVFLWLSRGIETVDDEMIHRIHQVFWITLISVGLTEAAVDFTKHAVMRPRPLSDAYALYNKGLRTIADEVVSGGHSYAASHSAILFAMITPLIRITPDRRFRAGLFLWGLFHAYTRVYLAAHFPYDSFMGAVLGFSLATVAVKAFKIFENKGETLTSVMSYM